MAAQIFTPRKIVIALAILLTSIHVAFADTPIRNRELFLGMHLHRADQGTAWPKTQFGSWRLWDAYVAWPNLQPQRDQWTFDRLDRYVAMARLAKVDILLPLGLSPRWASARPDEKSSYAPGNAAEPANMEDWRNYVRTVAQRYRGKISHFEIWNEPNEHGFFSGSVEKLVELTCEAHYILKSISPDIRLVSPSMVGPAKAPEQLAAFLEKGGRKCIDIVGFHFYVPKGPPETIVPLVKRVREVMSRHGITHLPLWNTEFGWWIENDDGTDPGKDQPWLSRISTQDSAAWVARALILGRAMAIERFYWYAWDNKSLGLIEPKTGSLKPGAIAFQTISRWLRDGDFHGCLQQEEGLWACAQRDNAGRVKSYVMWRTGSTNVSFRTKQGEFIESVEYLNNTTQRVTAEATANKADWPASPEPIRLILR